VTDNFARFGKTFQENLTRLIIDDRAFSDQILEVLDTNFFEQKYLQVFNKLLKEYKDKYGVHPTRSILETVLRTSLSEENELVQKQVRDFFARAIAATEDVKDVEYIKEHSLDFCKKQKLKEAMLSCAELLKSCKFEEIKLKLDKAMMLGMDNDFGHQYIDDFEERFKLKSRNPVTTGWKEIDALTKGGLGRGELGVVVAPTGAGKSMALVHLGAQAIKSGLNVVHYTLELSDTVVGSRYDACLTQTSQDALHGLKDDIYEEITKLSGGLIIKEYPTKSASTNTLRNHLERMRKREMPIDMIIVDYGDLLRPVSVQKEKRNELESIYEEMRGLAQEYECPIWTASQTNRSGYNSDCISLDAISEAFNKCFVADFICTISRNAEQKAARTGNMFVAKNRNGEDGLVYPMFVDTRKIDLQVMPYQGDTPSSILVTSVKEQKEKIREKYKDWKSQKQ
jgi:replicative DNA helicase